MFLTMSCGIERDRPSAERKASWHETCADPQSCDCAAHQHDPAPRPPRWTTPRATKNGGPR